MGRWRDAVLRSRSFTSNIHAPRAGTPCPARSYQLVGRVQQAQGQLDQALESYQASLRVGETLARVRPANAEWQRELIDTHSDIAEVHAAQGHLAAAIDSLRSAVAIAKNLPPAGGKASIKTSYYGLCAELRLLQRRSER